MFRLDGQVIENQTHSHSRRTKAASGPLYFLRGMELANGVLQKSKWRVEKATQPSLLMPGPLLSKSSVCPSRHEFVTTTDGVRLEFTFDEQIARQFVRSLV